MNEKYKIFKNPLKLGLLLLIVTVLMLALNSVAEISTNKLNGGNESKGSALVEEKVVDEKEGNVDDWDTYYNVEFEYSIDVPKLLLKREYTDQEDYLHFVKFEENQFSKEKGVAVGVSDRTLTEEKNRIRKDIEKEFRQVNAKEEEISLKGNKAVRIEYEEEEGFEPRSVVVLNDGKYSYSISTTPNQIDQVIEGFSLDY